jgi:hypothetical protein
LFARIQLPHKPDSQDRLGRTRVAGHTGRSGSIVVIRRLLIARIPPVDKLVVSMSQAAGSGGSFLSSVQMILIEPTENYRQRWAEHYRKVQKTLNAPPKYEDSWDEWIIGHPRATRDGPVPFLKVVNALARTSGAKSKRERDQVKIPVMKRLGALIRARFVCRYNSNPASKLRPAAENGRKTGFEPGSFAAVDHG